MKKEKQQFNSNIWQLDFFMLLIYFWHWYFLCWRFYTMSQVQGGASPFGGGCFSLVFPLICHAVITLRRNDNDDISRFLKKHGMLYSREADIFRKVHCAAHLDFSAISRKKAATFGFPIAAA